MLALVLSGCGGSADSPAVPGALVLQIHLPSALSRTERRRENFVRRVSRLELYWSTQSGKQGSQAYAPGQWDQMVLPETGFPVGAADRLNLSVRVWDAGKDGIPRLVPALSGRAVLKSEERASQGPTYIHLKLSLRVPVAEYD